MKREITQTKLIIYSALFMVLFDNYTFYVNTLKVYPLTLANSAFLLSLILVLWAVTVLLLTLVSSRYTTKPVLIAVLLISASTNYFMNTYHVIIDDNMIRNVLQTDWHESRDLLSMKLLAYIVFLGVLPAWWVWKVPVAYGTFKREVLAKGKTVVASLVLIALLLFSFSKYYASFFREHVPLRYNTNPTFWIYNSVYYLYEQFSHTPTSIRPIGTDAKIVTNEKHPKPRLVIMVVGEAARADHFSLNGYARDTNPNLAQENVISFTHFSSCGTSTAESVPCMFSPYNRSNYSYNKGHYTENALDVLKHTGAVGLLWRDNNSDSKGVALRIPYENYRTAKHNTVCIEGECRDEGMLVGLDEVIRKFEKEGKRNILIVLHQMGNHGPAYYKRYPKAFEKFTPVCRTNQLEECSRESIRNAYDNAILYTDYFLSRVIGFLKKYNKRYDTAMIYMSDHGESLGENGLYLHGLPYLIAPKAQTHIPALLWLGKGMQQRLNMDAIRSESNLPLSQDVLFSTLLGIFHVSTNVYRKNQDILHPIEK